MGGPPTDREAARAERRIGNAEAVADARVCAAKRFNALVYELVCAVPRGRVTTYGLIALALGAPRAARRVGSALAALPDYHTVPAHRVVNRSGILTGEHAIGPPGTMRALLEEEGVSFAEDGRVVMSSHLWEPPSHPETLLSPTHIVTT